MPLSQDLTKYTTASPLIATFDFTDIASGTGLEVYDLANTIEDTTKSYFLSDKTIYSNEKEITVTITKNTGTFTKLGDFDFDTSTQEISRALRGTAIVNLFTELTKPAGFTCQVYIIAKLRKWDGTIETDIASVQTKTISSSSGGREDVLSSQFEVP